VYPARNAYSDPPYRYTSSFGFGWNSRIPNPCAVRISAAVPSGRNVSSASCADPYRPMPSPATPFTPKSSFLWYSGQRPLTPIPPPTRVSSNAPAALRAANPVTGQVTTVGVAGAGTFAAFVPATAQGKILFRNVLMIPNTS